MIVSRKITAVILPLLALALMTSPGRADSPAAAVVSPVDAPVMTEADRFFDEYARAAVLMEKGARQQAAVVMHQLYRSLSTTPWLEIALLKHAELYEGINPPTAMESYDLLQKRLANAPYFQANRQRSQLFGAALQSAVDRGISRVRLQRVRDGLSRYFARYMHYPESLAKLAIFNYVEDADILNPDNRPFRYLPTGMQLRPTITYLRYELESIPAEPFFVTSPKIMGTSQVGEGETTKYVCLVRVPTKPDPVRVTEEQTLEGYYIAAIAARGAVLTGGNRLLVLPVPK